MIAITDMRVAFLNIIRRCTTRRDGAPTICSHTLGKNRIRIGVGNYLSAKGSFLTKTQIQIVGTENSIEIDGSCRLHRCSIRVVGNRNRIIIAHGAVLNNAELWIEDDLNEISIGADSVISGRTHIAAIEGTAVRIGPGCLLSSDIRFATGDSHSVVDANGSRINPSKSIEIAEHVWIGAGATILKGSSIQRNSIVGAKTVIATEYGEEGVVIVGNPGRIVKRNVNWERERI